MAPKFHLSKTLRIRFAARRVGDRDSGEDVAQNAWLRMSERQNATPIEHPKTCLFAATRNRVIDFTLRRQREWSRRVDFDTPRLRSKRADYVANFGPRYVSKLPQTLIDCPEI
ncbi:sigma factor [Rhizobium sp. LjRoot30]|uniref:sigma factor n=1 Tax=Rhizobium sp. LjRoot30 TaxID=3342320 RepID=UPI003ECFA42F